MSSDQLIYLNNYVDSLGITLDPVYSYTALITDAYQRPVWVDNGGYPSVVSFSTTTVTLKMRPTVVGEVCCMASKDSSSMPSEE